MAADFKFTSDASGQITGLVLVTPHDDVTMPVPDNASFTSSGTSVTETIAGDHVTRTITYTQDSQDASIYHISAESAVVTAPAPSDGTGTNTDDHCGPGMDKYFSFTITDGKVSAATETFSFGAFSHSIDLTVMPTATFTATTTGVTETRVLGQTVETLQFAPGTVAGHYDLVSDTKVFLDQDSQHTGLHVEPFERDQFSFDASGNLTGMKMVLPNGSTMDAPAWPNAHYSQLALGFVLETQTFMGHANFELFYDGNGDGTYMAVASGSGTTVDLVAVQAQLTTAGLTGIA